MPATEINHGALIQAARVLTDRLGSEELGSDVGGHMTCSEAEAVAEVMRAIGEPEAAAAWLAGHAEHDGEGDGHAAV